MHLFIFHDQKASYVVCILFANVQYAVAMAPSGFIILIICYVYLLIQKLIH